MPTGRLSGSCVDVEDIEPRRVGGASFVLMLNPSDKYLYLCVARHAVYLQACMSCFQYSSRHGRHTAAEEVILRMQRPRSTGRRAGVILSTLIVCSLCNKTECANMLSTQGTRGSSTRPRLFRGAAP